MKNWSIFTNTVRNRENEGSKIIARLPASIWHSLCDLERSISNSNLKKLKRRLEKVLYEAKPPGYSSLATLNPVRSPISMISGVFLSDSALDIFGTLFGDVTKK